MSGSRTDQASQSEQNSMLSSSVVFYMYSRTCTNGVWHVSMLLNLHHRPWDVTGWMLCNLRWNGTQFIKSYFCPQNYYTLVFVHSRASSTENKWSTHPLPLSSTPYPVPVSLSHTRTCTHSENTIASLSFFGTRNERMDVTFWWGNDDHGSLSSPWRMDPIHSVLVCAY